MGVGEGGGGGLQVCRPEACWEVKAPQEAMS